jgi:hypothetical protein
VSNKITANKDAGDYNCGTEWIEPPGPNALIDFVDLGWLLRSPSVSQ